MPNRLATETSPYLLQHAENPVDWYPWSNAALQKANEEQKPIFLSIGYSACHWCHVMEHESFEDPEIARQLNANFVCIKVDREERPDLDQIYMQAVQMLTGRGGWPMSVFLTPRLRPFFGGTYWPPRRRQGLPGFDDVLNAVLEAWTDRREQAIEQADKLTERVTLSATETTEENSIDVQALQQAASKISTQFDAAHGGFGSAPKFPHAMIVQFLLRMWHRNPERNSDLLQIARTTLDRMAAGGIYDHLAGGFARYSVDQYWLVPHFEKMLYDNALLADAYLDLYCVTNEASYRQVAYEVCNYVLRYMTDTEGGFHSTEDADSEGEEGKFYVWSKAEVFEALASEEMASKFCYVYDITDAGNFEGKNILNRPKTLSQCASAKGWDAEQLATEMQIAREQLLVVRDQRVRPGKDDKILASWNGLMIHSLARVGAALQHHAFIQAAAQAAEFILSQMRGPDERLLHTWRQGKGKIDGFLDDYANVANGLVTLYESTFDDRWINRAVPIAEMMLQLFHDESRGGFFYTAKNDPTLIARIKDTQDGSIPSGNSMAATVLLRLGQLCSRSDFMDAACATLRNSATLMTQYPLAAGQLLGATDFWLGPTQQIVLAQRDPMDEALATELRRRYLPRSVIAAPSKSKHLSALLNGKQAECEPALYVCQANTCTSPIMGEQIRPAITKLR